MTTPRRPASRQPSGDWGIITPLVLIVFAVTNVGFWPAMVWHGYTDTGGWRWDIHSTIAELAYFGTIAFITTLCVIANRRPKQPVLPPQPDRWWEDPAYQQAAVKMSAEYSGRSVRIDVTGSPGVQINVGDGNEQFPAPSAPAPPSCQHSRRVRVENILNPQETWAWWCPDCETQLEMTP